MIELVDGELEDEAVELCAALLRIDTTNPPGRERAAADLLAGRFRAAGLEPVVLEASPGRANIVVRLRGTGELPPLLLTAHLDVVPADAATWTHAPFAGEIADGFLWGRGAIDVKNMAAMCTVLLCRLARSGIKLRRDIVFAGVADEETGCDLGSRWLVDHHADLVRAEHAIGEGGGATMTFGASAFYPIEIAEKGMARMRMRARGASGHGSVPCHDNAVVKLARAIERVGSTRLPLHWTPVVAQYLGAFIDLQPAPLRPLFKLALRVPGALALIERADRDLGDTLGALLRNTATPTVVRAGDAVNSIPAVAEAELDGRFLPGQSVDDLLREVKRVVGPDVELEVTRSMPAIAPQAQRTPLFHAMADAVRRHHPGAVPVPGIVLGYTDAKAFTSLGMTWHGFAPVRLPPSVDFGKLFHGVDERIPVEGLKWGTRVLSDVLLATAAPLSPRT